MRTNRVVFIVFSVFLAFLVQAEEQMSVTTEEDIMLLYADEEMVSIATGTAKPIHLAPSVATVITSREIEASGARTLDEVLETVPGLHISKSTVRNSSIYSIRGIHTDQNPQVLLLVNGMAFNDIITGSRPPLFRLPIDNISRIEIVRGPGSAIFGADAFAGVINVITKDGSEIDGGVVGGRVGSFDTQDGWAQYGDEMHGWDVGVSLEYSTSEGDRDRIVNSDLQTLLDLPPPNGFGTSASLAPGPLESGYRLLNSSVSAKKDNWAIWLNSWNLDDAGVGPGVAQALDPVGYQAVDQYSFKLDYTNTDLVDNWRFDSSVSYRVMDQSVNYQILPPGTIVTLDGDGNLCLLPTCTLVTFSDGVLGNPGGELRDSHFEVAALYEGWLDHRLRLALGFDKDEIEARESKNYGPGTPAEGIANGSILDRALTDVTGTTDIFVQDRSRIVRYLSLQDEWRLGRDWELTAGVRYDDYSDFGDTTNPRLALVWATRYNLTSKLLYGRAFRAPSLTELYFENNSATIGNPDLMPEKIDMLELVFDYRPSFDLQTVLSLFAYQAEDLIEFIDSLAQNNRNQDGHGLELEAIWQVTKRLKFLSNFALQYSEDADTGEVTANAPRRQLFLATNWNLVQAWSVYGQANWVMDRSRVVGDSRPSLDDYTTIDLALRYRPDGQPWEMSISIKNAFDEDYAEPSDSVIPEDYPMEGRSAYLQARYHIN